MCDFDYSPLRQTALQCHTVLRVDCKQRTNSQDKELASFYLPGIKRLIILLCLDVVVPARCLGALRRTDR